jgi:ArsR family transcriptional regulator
LRDEHATRRLGFADAEVDAWFRAAGLRAAARRHLSGNPLTVGIWLAAKQPAAAALAIEEMT